MMPNNFPNSSVVDDARAPSIYVDTVIGAGATDGFVHVTFGARHWDHSVEPPRVYTKTVLRVTIPAAKLHSNLRFIGSVLDGALEVAEVVPAGARLQ